MFGSRLQSIVVISLFLGFSQTALAEPVSRSPIDVAAKWESKYVSEGRDNLGNGGLYSVEAVAEEKGVTAGASFASADRETYEELNLFVEYGFEREGADVSIGYTRLEFLKENEHDDELSFSISANNISNMTPALDYTWSDTASGGFLELSLRGEVELLNEELILEPYVSESFDFGYASEEHDGINNLQAGVDFAWQFKKPLNIVGSLNHSWAQKDVKNDGLGDVSWLTIGLSASF